MRSRRPAFATPDPATPQGAWLNAWPVASTGDSLARLVAVHFGETAMTDRPLFDAPPAGTPVKARKAKPVCVPRPMPMPMPLPVPSPRPTPKRWTVIFQPVGSDDVPPIIRIRRMLKNAWRCYGLKAETVTDQEFLTPAPLDSAGQDKPMASKACIGVDKVQRGPQTAFNRADGNAET